MRDFSDGLRIHVFGAFFQLRWIWLIRLFHHPDEVEEKDSWWGLAAGGRSPADMPSRAPFLSFFSIWSWFGCWCLEFFVWEVMDRLSTLVGFFGRSASPTKTFLGAARKKVHVLFYSFFPVCISLAILAIICCFGMLCASLDPFVVIVHQHLSLQGFLLRTVWCFCRESSITWIILILPG